MHVQAATLEQIYFFLPIIPKDFQCFLTRSLQQDAGMKSKNQVIHQTDIKGVGLANFALQFQSSSMSFGMVSFLPHEILIRKMLHSQSE